MNQKILELILALATDVVLPEVVSFFGTHNRLPTDEEALALFRANVDAKIAEGEAFLSRTAPK